MKRLLFSTLVIFLTGTACNVIFPEGVQGSGNIVTQSFDVNGFDQIELKTIDKVYIEQGESESLTIEADDNILPLLEVKVEDGKLLLTSKDNINFAPSIAITYRVTVKKLHAAIADSSGDFFIGSISGESLDILVNASGDVILKDAQIRKLSITSNGSGMVKVENVKAEEIGAIASASGNVDIAGVTNSLKVIAEGSGDVSADDLQAANVKAILGASGDITVWAVDTLNVSVDGSGNFAYYGNPSLTQTVSTSGVLQALGKK